MNREYWSFPSINFLFLLFQPFCFNKNKSASCKCYDLEVEGLYPFRRKGLGISFSDLFFIVTVSEREAAVIANKPLARYAIEVLTYFTGFSDTLTLSCYFEREV